MQQASNVSTGGAQQLPPVLRPPSLKQTQATPVLDQAISPPSSAPSSPTLHSSPPPLLPLAVDRSRDVSALSQLVDQQPLASSMQVASSLVLSLSPPQQLSGPDIDTGMTALRRDAQFTRIPSPSQAERINALILSKNPDDRQEAIELTLRAYGIGHRNDLPIEYDAKMDKNDEAETKPEQPIKIGPAAFYDHKDQAGLAHLRLALTLAHENLHLQQYRQLGDLNIVKAYDSLPREAVQSLSAREQNFSEIQAYQSELDNLRRFRELSGGDFSPQEAQVLTAYAQDASSKLNAHIKAFSPAQENLIRQGDLTGALKLIRQDVPATAYTSYAANLADKVHYGNWMPPDLSASHLSLPDNKDERQQILSSYANHKDREQRLLERGKTRTTEYVHVTGRLFDMWLKYGLS